MRILHISTRLILGGSQENTVLCCEGQTRLGHEVHLAFGPIHGPEGSLLDRVKAFGSINTHVVPHMVRQVNPPADWRCLRELQRLIAALKPDIVHTHSSKAGILGRSAAWSVFRQSRDRQGTTPAVVHTIHGPPFMPVEGGPLNRAKTRALNAAYTLAEHAAARRCHTIVSVADAMTRQFLARGIGRPDQYTTVYSGMETERFLTAAPGESREEVRRSLGLSPEAFVIGTVARLAQHKGHDDLIDALADDLRTHPHWRLLWVGDGWWKGRLLDRLRMLGLHKQVILTGLVPSERVPAMIRAMDILAHPSYREGLPRTVPQALLCSVCPVAYDVDGTGEVIRDAQTGRLIPLGDRDALRDAIRSLAEHPAECHAMALRGREECRTRFSAQAMIAALEEVYARALTLACG